MSHKREQITGALFSWFVGNLLGVAVTAALNVAVRRLPSHVPGPVASFTFIILVAPIGLAQWLVLRRLIHLTPLWVLTVPIGLLLFALIIPAFSELVSRFWDDESIATLSLGYAVFGAAMGLPQWLILRCRLTKAALWILGSALGMGLGFGLFLATDLVNQSRFVGQSEIIGCIVVSLVYSVATGFVLSLGLNHHGQTRYIRTSAT